MRWWRNLAISPPVVVVTAEVTSFSLQSILSTETETRLSNQSIVLWTDIIGMNGMLTWELKICMLREILFETDDWCELKALVLRGDTNETFCLIWRITM